MFDLLGAVRSWYELYTGCCAVDATPFAVEGSASGKAPLTERVAYNGADSLLARITLCDCYQVASGQLRNLQRCE